MRIVLLGYMGSGKTSIGKKLSQLMGIPFFDLDEYIEQQEHMTIPELFELKGEIYFRRKEQHYLEEFVATYTDFILAVGGGTPCYGSAMNIINEHTESVYLKGSLKMIYGLLSKPENKEKRPLIAALADEKLQEFIAKHLFERTPFYEKAKHVIELDGKTKEVIAAEISLSIQ